MSFVPLSALLFGSAPTRPPGSLDFIAPCPRRSGWVVAADGRALAAPGDDAARRIDGEQRAIDARARRGWRDPLQYRIDYARPDTRPAAVLQQAARLAAGLKSGPARGVALVETDGAVVLLLAALESHEGDGGNDCCDGLQLLAVADVGDRTAAECEELRTALQPRLRALCASTPAAGGLPAPTVKLVVMPSAAPPADPRTALAWALTPACASARAARRRTHHHRPLHDVQEKH